METKAYLFSGFHDKTKKKDYRLPRLFLVQTLNNKLVSFLTHINKYVSDLLIYEMNHKL